MNNLLNDLLRLRPQIAKAAQQVVDEWSPDEEGIDEVYGSGGVCDEVAQAIIGVIYDNLDVEATCGSQPGEDHEWVVVSNGNEAAIIDIPAGVYETGGGYSWKKIENAKIEPTDVLIEKVDIEDVKDIFDFNAADDINYALDQLYAIDEKGMTEDLWNLAKDDTKWINNIGAKNNRQRNLLFYLDNFCDDLCEELGRKNYNREEVISKCFDYLKNRKNININDIKDVISVIEKKAYPNMMDYIVPRPERDLDKWVETLRLIHLATLQGTAREEAKERLTEDWDPMEKTDFDSWMGYYERGDQDKYKTADLYPSFMKPEEELPKKKVFTPEDKKRSLVSRLDAADRLLRDFANVWPPAVWNRLHQALNDLKREIMMLRSASTMDDVIVKTANIWNRNGFSEGANILYKIAQGDVADEIEKALTGKEYKSEPTAGQAEEMAPPLGPAGEAPDVGLEAPPAGGAPDVGLEAPPAEAGEALPPPEMPPAGETQPEIKEEHKPEENPYKDISVADVITVLEPVQQTINSRDIVRELSKADMMLDSLGLASYFTELGEIMSKTLELSTYIGPRIDKVISRLKSGDSKLEEKKPAESIEMEELSAPVQPPAEAPAPENVPATGKSPAETLKTPVEEVALEVEEPAK